MKEVEIILGGGAAKGLAHIGVLEVLEERGIKVAAIAGCSMGAIVAACYSRRGKVADCYRIIDAFEHRSLFNFIRSPFPKGGIVSSRKYTAFLKEIVVENEFEKLSLPFSCNAVDLIKGKEVVLNRGNLIAALQATSAVPGIFLPVRIGHLVLVDGGVLNAVPVNLLSRASNRVRVAINVFSFASQKRKKISRRADFLLINTLEGILLNSQLEREREKSPGILESFLRSFLIMQQELAERNIRIHPPDLLVNVRTEEFPFFDFSSSAELVRRGREAMLELIDYLLFLINEDETM